MIASPAFAALPRAVSSPSRCVCMGGEDSLSTHRAPKHLSACPHSELGRTTRRYRRTRFKRLPGTRGVTVVLDGGI